MDRAYHRRQGTDARFEVCLGALLAQNTTWTGAERALANLKRHGWMDPRVLSRVPRGQLEAALHPAGTFRQKARYLHAFARHVVRECEGRLGRWFRHPTPDLRRELLALDGIGPETADDILVYAARRPAFIVDAYARRLTRRLGFGTGREPYADLQTRWARGLSPTARACADAHAAIVEHAKTTCTARRPRCSACPLKRLCPRIDVSDAQ